MFEISWIELAVIIALAYVWGRYSQWRRTLRVLLDNPNYFANVLTRYSELSAEEDTPPVSIELRSEWINDHCYLYRKDTNEFVGQGEDVYAAMANASKLAANTEYVIPKEMADKPRESQP